MLTIYHSTATGLEVVEQPTSGCWFNLVAPAPEEIVRLQQVIEAPQDFITYPLDLAEMPRTEKEDGATLLVLRVPHFHGEAADIPYSTVPLGIIFTDHYIATVCQIETDVSLEIAAGRARGLSTHKHNRFILQLLWIAAKHYLGHLRAINKSVDDLEDQLQHSLRNRELTGLLKYQKSLVYFITALKANELMLQHLQRSRLFQQYPDDEELLDDVLTEIQQAIEMTNISSSILSQMMDAFASIISNNLNVVMKFMAAATIIISLPTLIASLYGMNVPLPLAHSPWMFVVLVVISLAVALLVAGAFWRKDWL